MTAAAVAPPSLPRELAVRAADTLRYLALLVPLAIAGGVAVVVLAAGAVLALVWIGVPILALAVRACRAVARWHRALANRLLHAGIPPMRSLHAPARSWRDAAGLLNDRSLWPVLGLLAGAVPGTALAILAALLPALLAIALGVLGVESLLGLGDLDHVGPLHTGVPAGLLLLALAVPAGVVALAVLDGLHGLLRAAVRVALAPRADATGPVRELLAETLGDRSVSVAYWVPELERFVDESGRAVDLPEGDSGRTWTAVERDGRRVAAIVHDASLDASPELVQAAAAGAALAIDNERLKAELRAKVEELRVSRSRIVEAADAARRELERDLHDGAQQQLVALALELRLLKARLADEQLHPAVDSIATNLSTALEELRELARGIHPAVLTDRGLVPALEMVAARAKVPVVLEVDLGERLPAPIEAAAYFMVAEALTNVAKYAPDSQATVDIRGDGDELVVSVADRGPGGAAPDGGSGLRGLADRVAALDGTLHVHSPEGEGTVLRARIPIA